MAIQKYLTFCFAKFILDRVSKAISGSSIDKKSIFKRVLGKDLCILWFKYFSPTKTFESFELLNGLISTHVKFFSKFVSRKNQRSLNHLLVELTTFPSLSFIKLIICLLGPQDVILSFPFSAVPSPSSLCLLLLNERNIQHRITIYSFSENICFEKHDQFCLRL